MKAIYILLTITILAAGAPALSKESVQSGGLGLQGKVIAIKKTAEESSDGFLVELELEFSNSGEKPLILLRPTYDDGEWWLLNTQLSVDPTDYKTSLYVGGGGPASSHSMPKWGKLRSQLDRPLPPKTLTYLIARGEKVVYRTTTYVRVFHEDRKMLDRDLWLSVTLEMWPSNLEGFGRSEFQNKLKRRWANEGVLWVDSIISDPIQISLRQSH